MSFFTCIKVLISHETVQKILAAFSTAPKCPTEGLQSILFECPQPTSCCMVTHAPPWLHHFQNASDVTVVTCTMAFVVNLLQTYKKKMVHPYSIVHSSLGGNPKARDQQYLNILIILASTFMYESNALLCVQLFTLCV